MKRQLLILMTAMLLGVPAAAHAKRYNLTLNFGQDVLVVGKDDLSVRARCLQNHEGNGYDVLQLYAVTANNAVMRAAYSYWGNGNYLTSMTPPNTSILSGGATLTGVENFMNNIDAGYVLNLTTMHGYTVNVESTVFGLNSGGNDCLLSVDIREVKKFKAAN